MKRLVTQETKELIGILQSISVVAKNLAQRLIRIEEEIKRREERLDK